MVNICECCHEPLETEEDMLANGQCRCAGYCVECSKERCDGCEKLWEDCTCEPDDEDLEEADDEEAEEYRRKGLEFIGAASCSYGAAHKAKRCDCIWL